MKKKLQTIAHAVTHCRFTPDQYRRLIGRIMGSNCYASIGGGGGLAGLIHFRLASGLTIAVDHVYATDTHSIRISVRRARNGLPIAKRYIDLAEINYIPKA